MIAQDHLQNYTLTLTTRGLLHIGSGQKTPRKEYLFNSRKGIVSLLNERVFFDLLIEHDLVDMFEGFCLRNGGDLYRFLCDECGLTWEQIAPAVLYQVSADDALDERHSLKDINRFVRNGQGMAYVPGSSVKGALRTALLYQKMSQDNPQEHRLESMKTMEEHYLHTLRLRPNNPLDAVNSLMRGIQISDSEPIPDRAMTLSIKQDGFINGTTNTINLCRECVAPGERICFRLTLDQSILKEQVTVQSIMAAINAFAQYGVQAYENHFTPPQGYIMPGTQNLLYLGGGSGFLRKSLVYPYLGREAGLQFTSGYLIGKFRAHHHEQDKALGISPRTMKYGKFKQRLYAFGPCEVTIE